MSIEPFEIPSFTPEQRAKLQERLSSLDFPHEFEKNVGWSYGAPRWAVEPIAKQWRDEFDWEVSKAELQRWSHYRTEIEGIRIHFIHEVSKEPGAIPLMLLHGWPGSVYEFHKAIDALRDGVNGGQPFHVIVPSLPGYGFSDPPPAPGWGIAMFANIMNQLMLKLGYSKYAVHGGDWGATISKHIAAAYDENCKAFHTTMPIVAPPITSLGAMAAHPLKAAKFIASLFVGNDIVYGQGKVRIVGRSFADTDRDNEAGYRAIQGTRPYTLAYGLTDSPIGLLAWLLEKYHSWTFHAGEKDSAVLPPTIDVNELLTTVTIYWLTNTISSSIRLYYETFHDYDMARMFAIVKVPTAVSMFSGELLKMPREWIEAATNLVQWDEHATGGHFAMLEEPLLLIDDLQRFGKKVKGDFQQ